MKLNQETIAIVSAGATLAAIIVATAAILFTQNSNVRAEIQAMRAEARAARVAAPARSPFHGERHERRRE